MAFNPKPLNDLENFILEIKNSIPSWIKEVIEKNKDVILDMQLQGQFDKGKDSEGNNLFPPYASSTKKRKRRKGQPTNRVTLKDTGMFYKSVEVEVRNDEFEIKSDIDYSEYLIERYNTEYDVFFYGAIFGLTPSHLEDFTKNFIVPYIKIKINDKIAES